MVGLDQRHDMPQRPHRPQREAGPEGAPAVLQRIGGIAHPTCLLPDGRRQKDQQQERRGRQLEVWLGQRSPQPPHHPIAAHQDGRLQEHDRDPPALAPDPPVGNRLFVMKRGARCC
jgi:hypothetical protein